MVKIVFITLIIATTIRNGDSKFQTNHQMNSTLILPRAETRFQQQKTICEAIGYCQGDPVRSYSSTQTDPDLCLAFCKTQYTCEWWSYNMKSGGCELFKSCHTIDETQVDYVTGQVSCGSLPNILVTTGSRGAGIKTSEIINLGNENMICSDLKDYPMDIRGAVGSSLGSTPVICGGYLEVYPDLQETSDRCFGYIQGEWKEFAKMMKKRGWAAAIVFDGSLHIFGGSEFDFQESTLLQSSEIISGDGTATASTDLPVPLEEHAIASVNDTFSIITGGRTLDGKLDSTWYYNHVTKEFKEGPTLLEGRSGHGAGALIDSGTNQKIPVVTGGWNKASIYMDSTEFLINGEWKQGPALPIGMLGHSLVNYNGDLYAMGGHPSDYPSNGKAIHKLSCTNKNCKWTTISQELKVAREDIVAIPVIDYLVNCTPN